MPALAAALFLVAALPGAVATAAEPNPYVFAQGAPTVPGADGPDGARPLEAGGTYRSSLGPGAKAYYRVELDASSSTYISATALPPLGTELDYADGIRVSLQTDKGFDCSYERSRFGSLSSPRPLAATASRLIGPNEGTCQRAGTYYVMVERTGASAEAWDLELQYASEPALRGKAPSPPATSAPASPEASASPSAATGTPRPRKGGTGFNDARALESGAWSDRITPGATLFYRVPVEWGQRLGAGASLAPSDEEPGSGTGSATGSGTGASSGAGSGSPSGSGAGGAGGTGDYVSSALELALYNPVRGTVDRTDTSYNGTPKEASLAPLPPVAYGNRFAAANEEMTGARFAGWYYLAVHLNSEVAGLTGGKPLDLTLRLSVTGQPQEGPEYAGVPRPAGTFGVTAEDQEEAANGSSADSGADGRTTDDGKTLSTTAATAVAAGGLGTGTLLVAVLALWTLVARRAAARAERREQAAAGPPSHGYGNGYGYGYGYPGPGAGPGSGPGAGSAQGPGTGTETETGTGTGQGSGPGSGPMPGPGSW
ncbi:hypothetical protein HUT18_16680 [Streptomyces sp. NA04227]|uniref:hypothetical protein n=1 Tax=Streptomyces sp. NA04227 TaxID=2742136 RepID=UPI00158FDCB5|nr:hypothetical protein [Streptomyces sp. NA04227]QKW07775.1 hypothetical protein HUT18_16680 [Streptomyces sp. NA04227]